MAIRVRLIQIGNSRGIRIPKAILDQYRFEEAVDLEPLKGRLILKPVGQARQGWSARFQHMAKAGEDALLDGPLTTDWDLSHWQW